MIFIERCKIIAYSKQFARAIREDKNMDTLLDALQGTGSEFTENGMPTRSSSVNSVLDLFFKMGGARNTDTQELISWLVKAFGENPELTMKCIFYNRDVRGGQGERRSFRVFFKYLAENYPDTALKVLPFIPEYGRWDDVIFTCFDTPLESNAADFILSALKSGDKLCAKWMPRENKSHSEEAKKLMSYFDLDERSYRKLLAGNTQVVENLMCKNQWGEINYNHVPSIAMKNYRKAFGKHDQERFGKWIEDLAKPESGAKIHADAIFPSDIVKNVAVAYTLQEKTLLDAQWKALPDYMPKGKHMIPVCDVSGSMSGEPMNVCISLGIYLGERNEGPFKDAFITFSGKPTLQVLKGKTLCDKYVELIRAHWDMNTDLEAVFKLILNQAQRYNLPQESMPDSIVIISDMQFDQCIEEPDNSGMEMIRRMYQESGYNVPNVYFWNVRTSYGVPVKFDEKGTALISGYSPSIMKNFLEGDIDPIKIMLKTLNSERYSKIKL